MRSSDGQQYCDHSSLQRTLAGSRSMSFESSCARKTLLMVGERVSMRQKKITARRFEATARPESDSEASKGSPDELLESHC